MIDLDRNIYALQLFGPGFKIIIISFKLIIDDSPNGDATCLRKNPKTTNENGLSYRENRHSYVADLDKIVSFKFCQTNVDARKFKAGVHLLASGRPF